MDPSKRFTEDDKKRVVQYMNQVAKHARFDVDTNELIEYFKLLNYMQATLLPKIESHYFEVKKYVEPEDGVEESAEDKGE